MIDKKPTPAVWVGLLVLLLLSVVWVFWLPPRQTADFVGIAFAVAAHLLTVGVLEVLTQRRPGVLLTLGLAVTALLYWLAAVGTSLAFRLFFLPEAGILASLELVYLILAALSALLFWLCRRLDPSYPKGRSGDSHEQE